MIKKFFRNPFVSAKDEARKLNITEKNQSTSYQLAFLDQEFLLREELRPVRLQLELLRPELIQQEQGIEETIVVFGSARIVDKQQAEETLAAAKDKLATDPDNSDHAQAVQTAEGLLARSHYYDEAREFGRLVSTACREAGEEKCVVVTGGGPGIMEGANRGCHDVNAKSVSCGIVLPREEAPNPYVTPELTFKFHYFALRKMHFLMRARALVAFPGGFGTLDELFETLTLIQTRKIKRVPVLLYGESYWKRIINFQALVEEGVIAAKDLELIQYVDTPQAAWEAILEFYEQVDIDD